MPFPENRSSQPRLDISLPSLPQTLIPLLEKCRTPEADIRQLADLAARDIAVSAKVLRLANSAFIGARHPFDSINQAVIYLGRDTLHNIVIAIAIQEVFAQPASTEVGIDTAGFWYHALLTALLAKDMAQQCGFPHPAACYLAGLLHDVGKILLAKNFPGSSVDLGLHDSETSRLQEEVTRYGIDHAQAGGLLAKHWHLPGSVDEAISDHHQPFQGDVSGKEITAIVSLANRVGRNCREIHPDILTQARVLGLDNDRLRAAALHQIEQVSAVASTLGLVISSTPGDEDRKKPPTIPAIKESLAPFNLLLGALDNLLRAKDIDRVLRVLEESLASIFGVEQAVLLLPDKDNTRLCIRGSRRNRLVRNLLQCQAASPSATHLLNVGAPAQLPIIWARSPELSREEANFFDLFQSDVLHCLAFSGSLQGTSLLLYSPSEILIGTRDDRVQSLLLLLAHVGHRLQLEELQHRHVEAMARERVLVLEEAARTLAHEICNPLAVVRNYLLLINDRHDLPVGLSHDLRAIGNEVTRIEAISRQLNHLGRSPAQTTREPIHLPALIAETAALFSATAGRKRISLHCPAGEDMPMICGDRQSLQQTLHNLIANAIDAILPDGWVKVRCFSQAKADDGGEDIIVEVADSGPGLSAIARERLFRAGYSTKGPGHAGLGLAIVKKLVTDLGGAIDYATMPEGGAVFRLAFPAIFAANDCQSP
jgi:putative nucleotidyltransferase with HDIG domain